VQSKFLEKMLLTSSLKAPPFACEQPSDCVQVPLPDSAGDFRYQFPAGFDIDQVTVDRTSTFTTGSDLSLHPELSVDGRLQQITDPFRDD
jgi:hypothetical protein